MTELEGRLILRMLEGGTEGPAHFDLISVSLLGCSSHWSRTPSEGNF